MTGQTIPQISVEELAQRLSAGDSSIQLVDVREPVTQENAHMAKLTDDPKVQEFVAKEIAKAVKAETRRATTAAKEVLDASTAALKAAGDKAAAKAAAELAKTVLVAIKANEAAA